MILNPNQPREYDAVLGGQCPIPTNAAVLGGIKGIKKRLASVIIEEKIAAISEALNYGEVGLDLVICALDDESEQVVKAAYLLLKDSAEPRVKEILKEYIPWRMGELSYIFDYPPLTGINFVTLNPDGQTFMCGSYRIAIGNLHTKEFITTVEGFSSINFLVISANGENVFMGFNDKTIKVFNIHTWKLIRTLAGHSGSVKCGTITLDGEIFLSGSRDKTIKIWKVDTGQLIRTLVGHFFTVNSVAVCSYRQNIVSGSMDKSIKVWSLYSGELIRTLTGHSASVNTVAISPDRKIIVSGSKDKTIKVWNFHTGELIKTLTEHLESVNVVAISQNGKIMVSGSNDRTIKIWSLPDIKLMKTLSGHSDCGKYIAISGDGKTIISGSNGQTIQIWHVP